MTSIGEKCKDIVHQFIENGDFRLLKESYHKIIKLKNEFCDIEDILYIQLIELALHEHYSKDKMKLEYLIMQKTDNIDKMINVLGLQKTENGGTVTNIKSPICYLDQNVFIPFIENGDFGYDIPHNYVIPYSPAHILETGQFTDKKIVDRYIKLISEATNNYEIRFTESDFVIYQESPIYCYRRVFDGTDDIKLAKDNRVIDDEIEEIKYSKYRNKNLRSLYNSENVNTFLFDHREMVDEILASLHAGYDLRFIQENGNCNNYYLINGFIHNLCKVMDICCFKKDNKEKKIRSSRIDIEHLLYGSVSSMFITKDERLRIRAINIYAAMGKQIECPDLS
ncbi:hypothetical protein [Ruminococcus sp. HUN007]|uniref:hypothetical protein n=1 Tax=Ruminococcus sp. HUN007 TaxID=1514668 RepID=UPI0005D1FB6F|nr:hypothetical protein [Ruminococcus sp. HUN007]